MNYDWIVVGGGFAGGALAYELASKDFAVLLLEKDATLDNATRYSYGGLAYWSGTDEITKQLCAEGIEIHRHLSEELDADTEFREIDLLLTIDRGVEPQKVVTEYRKFALAPKLLNIEQASELEPLLNKNAIAGALHLNHGHIHPLKTTQGYLNAFLHLGGKIAYDKVVELLRAKNRILGVKTTKTTYNSPNTVICAGGFSRSLLHAAGIKVRVYFTHSEIIKTPPVNLKLRTLVMPADTTRFTLEAEASKLELDRLWNQPGYEPVPAILDPGAIQFLDNSIRIGQISRTLTDPNAKVNELVSEARLRSAIGKVLPALENLPGTWHHCLVAFAHNKFSVVGALEKIRGIYLFSGFTNTLVLAPPLAKHFAIWATGQKDEIIAQLSDPVDYLY
ncbi:NAD(P)/FAD-dependent oxidoreductase [Oscillatoria salina]|uniref:NAD(P)/FAD-dependent oxidoreductase n=1 Tax=Oscillatoria salina TaxID=331517 RepID=UPI001CCCE647|nr:FAD-binding oxidoreductase [Oscillatoria salina]